jgi:serine/threonine-protein kinase
MIGAKLAHYEITALLGKGGMGEVYRGRDTKLKRDVAIKVLPEEFSRDADRVSRFQREAEVLASLNHPNIAAIYDLQEAEGSRFLVLELVEGETLADRIQRGAIPVNEALGIAKSICEALEAAHEKGIVHRDLKPANVKITPDGKVKVLDFGLAKAMESGPMSTTLSNSPTLVSGTMGGMIVGTAAYMSPEQARGREADQRSDIFSFGCVLYEMLTGRQAFQGEDVSDVLASVMKIDPKFELLPADLDPRLNDLLRRCLTKNRKERWYAIGDTWVELQRITDEPLRIPGPIAPRSESKWITKMLLAAATLTTIAAAIAIGFAWRTTHSASPSEVIRFPFILPEGQHLSRSGRPFLTISPDGDRIVYVANNQLYMRVLSDAEAHPIDGTATDPALPFFSPDGQWIGFYSNSDNKLKKVAITGGAAITISDQIGDPYGASWGANGQIVVARQRDIARVSAIGGKPEILFKPDPGQIVSSPYFLPDGDHFLFATGPDGPDRWGSKSHTLVQSLRSGERKVLLEGGADVRYVSTGHLIYALGPTLLSIRFDVSKLAVSGGPVPVLENISPPPVNDAGNANFSVANNGTLVYALPIQTILGQTRLTLVDRRGSRRVLPLPAGQYADPRISPDGKQLAVALQTGNDASIWLYDISGATSMRRLTFEGNSSIPLWTRDGRRLIFRSNRGEGDALFWQNADGNGVAEPLTTMEKNIAVAPNSVSPDGKTLAFFKDVNGGDVWLVSLTGDKAAKSLISAPVTHEDHSNFSPDGKWIAYRSTNGTLMDVFVQPFPPTGTKYQVTTSGTAQAPLWSPDGKQIFYVEFSDVAGQVMSVDVHVEKGLSFGPPTKIVDGISPGLNFWYVRPYDVSPDGKAFLVMTSASNQTDRVPPPEFRIVVNWLEELKQRVPVH